MPHYDSPPPGSGSLPSGTGDDKVLMLVAGVPTWVTVDTAVTAGDVGALALALADAKGDLIVASAADVLARLGVGANGTILTADSAQTLGVKWSAAPGGGILVTIVDAKGDLIVGDAADSVARLAVGTNGQVLTADSTQATGVKWAAASGGGGDLSFSPMVLPLANPQGVVSSLVTLSLHTLRAQRMVVSKTGTLHDFSAFIGVAAGNAIAAIYDVGDATAGTRTKLWDSGSVVLAGSSAWQVLGDPALAVTRGQNLDFAVTISDNTATMGRAVGITAAAAVLPTSFLPGSVTPKAGWSYDPGSFTVPATVSEANAGAASTNVYAWMARVA